MALGMNADSSLPSRVHISCPVIVTQKIAEVFSRICLVHASGFDKQTVPVSQDGEKCGRAPDRAQVHYSIMTQWKLFPGVPPHPGYPSTASASGIHRTAPSIVHLLVPSGFSAGVPQPDPG